MRQPRSAGKAIPTARDERHPFGPRPVGALVAALTRPAFRQRSPAAAQLMTDWAAVVGPALAVSAQPRRLVAGTLTVGCTGPVALELQHLAGPLIERINTHFGRPLVARLRFVQLGTPHAPPPCPEPPRQRPPPVAVDGLPDGPLRDALGALGAAIARRG